MKKILVIVDMQEGFSASNNKILIRGISDLCEKWNDSIIILEYVDYGRTPIDILNACRNNHIILDKNIDDGSLAIKSHLRKNNLISNKIKFYICGVNSDFCVKDTADGLCKIDNSVVNIIRPLCNSNNNKPFRWLKFRDNINGIKTIPRIRKKNEKARKLVGC